MRMSCFAIAATLLLASPIGNTAQANDDEESDKICNVMGGRTNLRTGPGLEFPVKRMISNNTKISQLEQHRGWRFIVFEVGSREFSGWVRQDFIYPYHFQCNERTIRGRGQYYEGID